MHESRQRMNRFHIAASAELPDTFWVGLSSFSLYEKIRCFGTAFGSTVIGPEMASWLTQRDGRELRIITQLEPSDEQDVIVRELVAAAMMKDGKRNFWHEIKRMRSCKGGTSRIVDVPTDVGNVT